MYISNINKAAILYSIVSYNIQWIPKLLTMFILCCVVVLLNFAHIHQGCSTIILGYSNHSDSDTTWARFLSLAQSKLRLCLANHRTGYFSNLACDWLSIVWAYSEQETENGPWRNMVNSLTTGTGCLDSDRVWYCDEYHTKHNCLLFENCLWKI